MVSKQGGCVLRPQAKVPYDTWTMTGSGGGGGGQFAALASREQAERLKRGLLELEEGIKGAAQQLCQVRTIMYVARGQIHSESGGIKVDDRC